MSKIALTTTISDLFFSKPNYERNITDIKNIYLSQLVKILTPCMFDSIKNIYNRSCDISKGSKMSVEYAFKVCLKDLNNLSSQSISNEVAKIKQLSKSGSYFDKLVRSVIKSHIVLMSYNVSKESCPVCNINNYNIDINRFIHECYIELAGEIFNDPRIFVMCLRDGDSLNNINGDIRCGNRFDKIVKRCISKVIFNFIPVNDVLTEYLNRDKITDEHLQAKQEMEKEEFINRIIEGVSERIGNNNINVDEIVNKVVSKINISMPKREEFKNFNNELKIEEPVDIEHLDNHITEIKEDNVNDILIDDKNEPEQTMKDVENVIRNEISVNPTTADFDENEKEPVVVEQKEEEKKNDEKDENDEILLTEGALETKENVVEEKNEIDEEIRAIEGGGVEEENKIEEIKDDERVEEVKEQKEQKEDVKEIKETPKRRGKGRPRKFVEDADVNSVSLNKFK